MADSGPHGPADLLFQPVCEPPGPPFLPGTRPAIIPPSRA